MLEPSVMERHTCHEDSLEFLDVRLSCDGCHVLSRGRNARACRQQVCEALRLCFAVTENNRWLLLRELMDQRGHFAVQAIPETKLPAASFGDVAKTNDVSRQGHWTVCFVEGMGFIRVDELGDLSNVG